MAARTQHFSDCGPPNQVSAGDYMNGVHTSQNSTKSVTAPTLIDTTDKPKDNKKPITSGFFNPRVLWR
ncbi:MAG TPA: hypothetical protein VK253_00975 [Candidatus Binatia bacterium]|nr:hypothetical protein [Candidatus Binatia bacterium]